MISYDVVIIAALGKYGFFQLGNDECKLFLNGLSFAPRDKNPSLTNLHKVMNQKELGAESGDNDDE